MKAFFTFFVVVFLMWVVTPPTASAQGTAITDACQAAGLSCGMSSNRCNCARALECGYPLLGTPDGLGSTSVECKAEDVAEDNEALPPEEGIGVAFIPNPALSKDPGEKSLHEAIGSLSDVRFVHHVQSPDEMFEILMKYKAQNRKISFLVIGGHGGIEETPGLPDKFIGIQMSNQTQGLLAASYPDENKLQDEIAKWQANKNPNFLQRTQIERNLPPLLRRQEMFNEISAAFTRDAQIYLYNCNTLAADNGKQMVKNLGQIFLKTGGGTIYATEYLSKIVKSADANEFGSSVYNFFIGGDAEKGTFVKPSRGDWEEFKIKAN